MLGADPADYRAKAGTEIPALAADVATEEEDLPDDDGGPAGPGDSGRGGAG